MNNTLRNNKPLKFQNYITFLPLLSHILVILFLFCRTKVDDNFSLIVILIEIVSRVVRVFKWFYMNARAHTSFGKQISN